MSNYNEYLSFIQKGTQKITYVEWCELFDKQPQENTQVPTLKDKLWDCYNIQYKDTYTRWLRYEVKAIPFGVDGFIHYLKGCNKNLYNSLLSETYPNGFDLLNKYNVGLNNTLQVKIETLFEGLPYEEDIPKTPLTDTSKAISGRMVGLWGDEWD